MSSSKTRKSEGTTPRKGGQCKVPAGCRPIEPGLNAQETVYRLKEIFKTLQKVKTPVCKSMVPQHPSNKERCAIHDDYEQLYNNIAALQKKKGDFKYRLFVSGCMAQLNRLTYPPIMIPKDISLMMRQYKWIFRECLPDVGNWRQIAKRRAHYKQIVQNLTSVFPKAAVAKISAEEKKHEDDAQTEAVNQLFTSCFRILDSWRAAKVEQQQQQQQAALQGGRKKRPLRGEEVDIEEEEEDNSDTDDETQNTNRDITQDMMREELYHLSETTFIRLEYFDPKLLALLCEKAIFLPANQSTNFAQKLLAKGIEQNERLRRSLVKIFRGALQEGMVDKEGKQLEDWEKNFNPLGKEFHTRSLKMLYTFLPMLARNDPSNELTAHFLEFLASRTHLNNTDSAVRVLATQCVGRICAVPTVNFEGSLSKAAHAWEAFMQRFKDTDLKIRAECAKLAKDILSTNNSLRVIIRKSMWELLGDQTEEVKRTAFHCILDMLQEKKYHGLHPSLLYKAVEVSFRDKQPKVRNEAITSFLEEFKKGQHAARPVAVLTRSILIAALHAFNYLHSAKADALNGITDSRALLCRSIPFNLFDVDSPPRERVAVFLSITEQYYYDQQALNGLTRMLKSLHQLKTDFFELLNVQKEENPNLSEKANTLEKMAKRIEGAWFTPSGRSWLGFMLSTMWDSDSEQKDEFFRLLEELLKGENELEHARDKMEKLLKIVNEAEVFTHYTKERSNFRRLLELLSPLNLDKECIERLIVQLHNELIDKPIEKREENFITYRLKHILLELLSKYVPQPFLNEDVFLKLIDFFVDDKAHTQAKELFFVLSTLKMLHSLIVRFQAQEPEYRNLPLYEQLKDRLEKIMLTEEYDMRKAARAAAQTLFIHIKNNEERINLFRELIGECDIMKITTPGRLTERIQLNSLVSCASFKILIEMLNSHPTELYEEMHTWCIHFIMKLDSAKLEREGERKDEDLDEELSLERPLPLQAVFDKQALAHTVPEALVQVAVLKSVLNILDALRKVPRKSGSQENFDDLHEQAVEFLLNCLPPAPNSILLNLVPIDSLNSKRDVMKVRMYVEATMLTLKRIHCKKFMQSVTYNHLKTIVQLVFCAPQSVRDGLCNRIVQGVRRKRFLLAPCAVALLAISQLYSTFAVKIKDYSQLNIDLHEAEKFAAKSRIGVKECLAVLKQSWDNCEDRENQRWIKNRPEYVFEYLIFLIGLPFEHYMIYEPLLPEMQKVVRNVLVDLASLYTKEEKKVMAKLICKIAYAIKAKGNVVVTNHLKQENELSNETDHEEKKAEYELRKEHEESNRVLMWALCDIVLNELETTLGLDAVDDLPTDAYLTNFFFAPYAKADIYKTYAPTQLLEATTPKLTPHHKRQYRRKRHAEDDGELSGDEENYDRTLGSSHTLRSSGRRSVAVVNYAVDEMEDEEEGRSAKQKSSARDRGRGRATSAVKRRTKRSRQSVDADTPRRQLQNSNLESSGDEIPSLPPDEQSQEISSDEL